VRESNKRWRGLGGKEKDDIMLMGVVLLYRLPFKTLGQFNVFPKNKLQPKKKNTKSSALKTLRNSQHWQDLIEMTADGSHLQQFCIILCFVSKLSLAAKTTQEKRLLFLTGTINLVFLTKGQIK